jgi:hypothetical protein
MRKDKGVEEYNAAFKIRLKVEHRLGEVLRETVRPRGRNSSGNGVLPEEITKMQSSRTQEVASVPWAAIEKKIDEATAKNERASKSATVKKLVKEQEREEALCRTRPRSFVISPAARRARQRPAASRRVRPVSKNNPQHDNGQAGANLARDLAKCCASALALPRAIRTLRHKPIEVPQGKHHGILIPARGSCGTNRGAAFKAAVEQLWEKAEVIQEQLMFRCPAPPRRPRHPDEFGHLVQALREWAVGLPTTDQNTPRPADSRPDEPTVAYCLCKPRVVRWVDEVRVRPMLWKILNAVLSAPDRSLPLNDLRRQVYRKQKGEASVRNDLSELNGVLEEVKFPLTLGMSGKGAGKRVLAT